MKFVDSACIFGYSASIISSNFGIVDSLEESLDLHLQALESEVFFSEQTKVDVRFYIEQI